MDKTCSICGVVKPIEDFGIAKRLKEGRHAWCRACGVIRRNKWREAINARKREHYQENKVAILIQRKEYYQEKQADILTKRKEYYQENREEKKAKAHEYRATNPGKCSITKKRIYAASKGTWEYFFRVTWNTINTRTVNGQHPNPRCPRHKRYLDRGIRIEMEMEEYRLWCSGQAALIEQMYRDGLRPSIDRIDSKGNYAIANLRVLPLSENCRRAAKGE